METLTIKFRNPEEAARCDLTRLGNVAAASQDGLTVTIEDIDLSEWQGQSRHLETDNEIAAVRAAMAACGVWVEVS